MEKILLIINNHGDEFNYFKQMLNNKTTILYIGESNTKNSNYLKQLVDMGLIEDFHIYKLNTRNGHYLIDKMNLQEITKENKYDKIYTYGINEDTYKDDIIYYLSKQSQTIVLASNESYPNCSIKLTEDEYCLKNNLMLNLGLKVNLNAVENYVQYLDKDIQIYYNFKYSNNHSDYMRSTYIIDIEYAILSLIKKYNFQKILLKDWDLNVVSPRVNASNFTITTNQNDTFDVVITNQNKELTKAKYIIALNQKMSSKYKEIEKCIINPVLEKLYEDDYKSSIDIIRPRMEIILYEKK